MNPSSKSPHTFYELDLYLRTNQKGERSSSGWVRQNGQDDEQTGISVWAAGIPDVCLCDCLTSMVTHHATRLCNFRPVLNINFSYPHLLHIYKIKTTVRVTNWSSHFSFFWILELRNLKVFLSTKFTLVLKLILIFFSFLTWWHFSLCRQVLMSSLKSICQDFVKSDFLMARTQFRTYNLNMM